MPEPELEEDDLWAITGARSLEACVAWKTGSSPSHAAALAAVARRAETFPRCVAGLREGSLSLDQVAVIAERTVDGSDGRRGTGGARHRLAVVVHLDVAAGFGSLHLGPALSEAERRYLSCDSLVETWFERDGTPIGVGRSTREIPRRIRRALEHRHATCAVPGCGATRGLHAHHIWPR